MPRAVDIVVAHSEEGSSRTIAAEDKRDSDASSSAGVTRTVLCTKGRGELFDGRWSLTGETPWRFQSKQARDRYQQEHDDLFDAIRNDKPYNEAEYGAHSTMTAIFGRMATYSGKVVEWDKAINSELSYFPDELAWDAEPKSHPNSDGWYNHPVPGKTRVI